MTPGCINLILYRFSINPSANRLIENHIGNAIKEY